MTVTLRPLPPEQLSAWLDHSSLEYAEERMANGDSPEVAAARAQESRDQMFPGDVAVDHQLVYEVVADETPVGALWIGAYSQGHPAEWWVWDIEIAAEHRGKCYGREAMLLAEASAAQHGASQLGLNVFGTNVGAQRLYASLGYATTSTNMSKRLSAN